MTVTPVTEIIDVRDNIVYPRPEKQDIMLGLELCPFSRIESSENTFNKTVFTAVQHVLEAASMHGVELCEEHIGADITIVACSTENSPYGDYVSYIGDVLIRLTDAAPDIISNSDAMVKIFDDVAIGSPLVYAGFFGDQGEGIITWIPESVEE